MIRSTALRTHRIAAWALVAGVGAQLAMTTFGMFIVAGSRGYLLHATFGRLLAVLPLLLLVSALVGRVDGRGLALTVGLVALVATQVALVVLAHAGVSAAMALHPVNGGAILALAGIIAGRADGYDVRARRGSERTAASADGVAAAGA